MSKATKTVTISSKRYEDHDDGLTVAAQDYAEEHGLELWQVSAAWADDANREEIVLTVPA